MSAPLHVVPRAPEHHGVVRCARELAAATGADVSSRWRPGSRQHVHFTDRLFGRSPEAAAEQVARLCAAAPTTLTLHDVPQPGDGETFVRRVSAYARVVAAAVGWVTNSHHEHDLLLTHTISGAAAGHGTVIPLAVTRSAAVRTPAGTAVAVLGWVYPGKGHREVIDAVAALPRDVEVLALGAVSPGHGEIAGSLAEHARRVGVRFRVTGPLADDELTRELRRAAAGVAFHHNVSASGSVNSWISAGRRPLVRDGTRVR